MNVFTATGRLGRDAEVRHTAGGTTVANMAIAVDVGYGDNKSTLWLDAALFGKRAEGGLIQYLTKGKRVAVSGEIGTRQYQKGNGEQGFAVTLRINEIDLIGGQEQRQQGDYIDAQSQYAQQQRPASQQHRNQQGAYGPPVDDFLDDIPFAPAPYLFGG